jgi:hypothetical protein
MNNSRYQLPQDPYNSDVVSDASPESYQEGDQVAWLPMGALRALRTAGKTKAVQEAVGFERAARRAHYKPNDPSRVAPDGRMIWTADEIAEAKKDGIWDIIKDSKAPPQHQSAGGGHLYDILNTPNPRPENFLTREVTSSKAQAPWNARDFPSISKPDYDRMQELDGPEMEYHRLALEKPPITLQSLREILGRSELNDDIGTFPDIRGSDASVPEYGAKSIEHLKGVQTGLSPKEALLGHQGKAKSGDREFLARSKGRLKALETAKNGFESGGDAQGIEKQYRHDLGSDVLTGTRDAMGRMKKERDAVPETLLDYLARALPRREEMPLYAISPSPMERYIGKSVLESDGPDDLFSRMLTGRLSLSEQRLILGAE